MSTAAETIGVVGAGTMGHGIAHVAARSGFDVILIDIQPELAARGLQAIEAELQRAVEKQRLTAAEATAALRRVRTGTAVGDLEGAGLVVEAIVEKEAAKAALFAELDRVCRPDAILASNTSSISITRLGSA